MSLALIYENREVPPLFCFFWSDRVGDDIGIMIGIKKQKNKKLLDIIKKYCIVM